MMLNSLNQLEILKFMTAGTELIRLTGDIGNINEIRRIANEGVGRQRGYNT